MSKHPAATRGLSAVDVKPSDGLGRLAAPLIWVNTVTANDDHSSTDRYRWEST